METCTHSETSMKYKLQEPETLANSKKKKHDNAVSKANQQIHAEFKSGHLRSNTNAEHGPPWPSPQACSPWAIASLGLEVCPFRCRICIA